MDRKQEIGRRKKSSLIQLEALRRIYLMIALTLIPIMKGCLIPKYPNSIKNRLDNKESNSILLSMVRGPPEEKDHRDERLKRVLNQKGKDRYKIRPHPFNFYAVQKAMINCLFPIAKSSTIRVDVTPILKRESQTLIPLREISQRRSFLKFSVRGSQTLAQ